MLRLILIVLCATAALAMAADPGTPPDNVDRSIRTEPKYSTPAPTYALLLFGPEARTRVWLVLDDETLYVDRNGDGDLTQAGEALQAIDRNGNRTFVAEGVAGTAAGEVLEVSFYGFSMEVALVTPGKRRLYATPQFAEREKSPVIRLDGPLALQVLTSALHGARPTKFSVHVTSRGADDDTSPILDHRDIPKEIAPKVEFTFIGADGKPIVKQATMADRCCAGMYSATIAVPYGVTAAKARATITFETLPGVTLAPLSVDVPITDAPTE